MSPEQEPSRPRIRPGTARRLGLRRPQAHPYIHYPRRWVMPQDTLAIPTPSHPVDR